MADPEAEKAASATEVSSTPTPGPEKNGQASHRSVGRANSKSSRELVASDSSTDDGDISYLHGVRFYLLVSVITIMLFLVSLDATITTTAIVTITEDLGGLETASWIISAYQLGWVAVVVIFSKFSDIFGRKLVFVSCIIAFAIFSGGCAAAQSMPQLIILRAFQGLGGGGCLALTTIIINDSVPPARLGAFASKLNVAVVMSLVLGPILGGAISSRTTWRWIFLINIPISAVAILLAAVGIPAGFPHHGRVESRREEQAGLTAGNLARVDLPGSILLLLAALAFTACFQEADSRFAWDSAYVISLLITSVALWVILLLWERRITLAEGVIEPVLPWRFFTSRIRAAVMLGFMFVGVPMVVTNFQLPQRFQLVNGLSSIDAGVRILPFGAAFCVGSMASSQVSNRLKVPSIYHILFGSVLQVIGFALLGVLTASAELQPVIYGYQVICGAGVGINYMALYLLIPFTADRRDKALGLGLAAQVRTMGSAFGLAIVTSVFNGYTVSGFANLGIPFDASSIQGLSSEKQDAIPPALLAEVRGILSEGYNRQMLVLCAFAAAQTPAALLLWKRKQITIP